MLLHVTTRECDTVWPCLLYYMIKRYLVNNVGITLWAQELPLREAAWPAVGEELEAKSNGLWHRATVAEIGWACWTPKSIQFHKIPKAQTMCVCVCSDLVCSKGLGSLYGMLLACQHITWTWLFQVTMVCIWLTGLIVPQRRAFCHQLVDCSRVEQRVMDPHVGHTHARIPRMFGSVDARWCSLWDVHGIMLHPSKSAS